VPEPVDRQELRARDLARERLAVGGREERVVAPLISTRIGI
jgi:hypothetical protein